MEILKVIIARGGGRYGVYSENAPGIWGEGLTAAEAKQSFIDAIDLYTEYNESKNVPAILKGQYSLEWEVEVES